MYDGKYVRFFYLQKAFRKRYQAYDVSLAGLSDTVALQVVDRLQPTLFNILQEGIKSRKARQVFTYYTPYLESVEKDLAEAVAWCSTPQDEIILLDAIDKVARDLNGVLSNISNTRQVDLNRAEYLRNDSVFVPFERSRIMYKL